MNERIRQLSEQAHHSTRDELVHLERVHNRIYDLNESAVIYNEKFAELIVGECVAIANRQFSAATGLDDRDCLTAQQMKQHFGVGL